MNKGVKIQHGKQSFYLPILEALKHSTNLTKIAERLDLSKQALNYYIRQLRNNGLIIRKGKGYYEPISSKNWSKNHTKYGSLLPPDISRGHAFVWTLKLPKEIKDWNKRIEILNTKGINHKLVGILKNIPRIKTLGRKIWLCNDHIRIFDTNTSYYGNNAIESKRKALMGILEVISALENKLGFIFKPLDISTKREHYALIKNDLAIDQNKKGIIWRISDESGEWLLIDDSLEQGGELETIGKSAFKTNLELQKWWNEQKETKFQVSPSFILNAFGKQAEQNNLLAENIRSHLSVIEEMKSLIKTLKKTYVDSKGRTANED